MTNVSVDVGRTLELVDEQWQCSFQSGFGWCLLGCTHVAHRLCRREAGPGVRCLQQQRYFFFL